MTHPEQIPVEYFERLFAASEDPWAFKTRWYEVRKRALTLASLPDQRYGRAYEPGCANGELSAALADRCDELLVSDGADKAVQLATRRVAAFENVTVVKAWLPQDWPSGPFDLIVLSELGYYLDAASLAQVAKSARDSLDPGGTVIACHWRPRIEGCTLTGDDVHRLLGAALELPRLASTVDADLRIDVWCADARSVGCREGLTRPCSRHQAELEERP